MSEDKQDWKERALNKFMGFMIAYCKSPNKDLSNDAAEWFDDFIQPIQSQNEALQKQFKDDLKAAVQIGIEKKKLIFKALRETRAWHKSKIGELQKEVKDLDHSKLVQAAIIIEQEEENAKLKAELKAWEDQDGITVDTAKEEIERLKGYKEDLQKEVKSALYLVDVREKENQELKEVVKLYIDLCNQDTEGYQILQDSEGQQDHRPTIKQWSDLFKQANDILKNNV